LSRKSWFSGVLKQYNYSFMPKGDVNYQVEAVDKHFNKRRSSQYKITLTEAVYINRKFHRFDISFGMVRFINCSITLNGIVAISAPINAASST